MRREPSPAAGNPRSSSFRRLLVAPERSTSPGSSQGDVTVAKDHKASAKGRGRGRGGRSLGRSANAEEVETGFGDQDDRRIAAHLSLTQLKDRFEKQELRLEQWRQSALHEQSVEAKLRYELNLAEACAHQAAAARQHAAVESAEAAMDMSVLAQDLPILLSSRCSALQRELAEVDALTEQSMVSRHEEAELSMERSRRRAESESLWREAEAWRERCAPVRAECIAADERVGTLRKKCGRAGRAFRELEEEVARETHHEGHHASACSRLDLESGQLDEMHQVMRGRHECATRQSLEKTESVHLATRLEREALQRSFDFHHGKLQMKVQEANWWRACADRLGRNLEDARAQREGRIADLNRQSVPKGMAPVHHTTATHPTQPTHAWPYCASLPLQVDGTRREMTHAHAVPLPPPSAQAMAAHPGLFSSSLHL